MVALRLGNDSRFSASLWPLWISRSRIASARAGALMKLCQSLTGSCPATIVAPLPTRSMPAVVLNALYEVHGADPLWVLTGLKVAAESPRHLDVLEAVIAAVEARLKASRRRLPPAKKARLIKPIYRYFREKSRIDPAHVAEMMDLAA